MLIDFFTDPLGLEAQRIKSNMIINEKIKRNNEYAEYLENIMRNKIYAKKLAHFIHAKHHQITSPAHNENGFLMGFSNV